jgi:two-component system, probable response regulator PhcQ
MTHNVLIVDDDPSIRNLMRDALATERYRLLSADSAERALEILKRELIDVVISDDLMPGMSGSEFLSLVKNQYPNTVRIMLTGHASVEGAIRAINEGQIYHFFTKPCRVYDLAITVRKALQQNELLKKSRDLLRLVRRQSDFIDELEKQYPGITRVNKDDRGSVLMNNDDAEDDYDTLIKEIRYALNRGRRSFLKE